MKYNREHVLQNIVKSEDRLFAARLLDKAEFTVRTNRLAHSDFLDPRQQKIAQRMLDSADLCRYSFYGGYSSAERSIVLFIPDFTDEDELEQYCSAVLKVVEITPLMRGGLSHRDYLGSLMGLGIKRSVAGDIIVSEEKCRIIAFSDIAEYVAGNLDKVGNIGVSAKISDIMELSVPAPAKKEIKAVVSALRLDCICASAFGLSRNKAAEFIKGGKVQLNWEITTDTDRQVREGDTISMRGKGKAVLEKESGRTKKDRIGIIIAKYM